MSHGGDRTGAGHKKGIPNGMTSEIRRRSLESGQSPLELVRNLSCTGTETEAGRGFHRICYSVQTVGTGSLGSKQSGRPLSSPKL